MVPPPLPFRETRAMTNVDPDLLDQAVEWTRAAGELTLGWFNHTELSVDSKGDVYVAEVTWTFAVSRGLAPADCHTFQKFALGT